MLTVTEIRPTFARGSESCSARVPTPSTTPRTYAKQQTAGFRIWTRVLALGLSNRELFLRRGGRIGCVEGCRRIYKGENKGL